MAFNGGAIRRGEGANQQSVRGANSECAKPPLPAWGYFLDLVAAMWEVPWGYSLDLAVLL